MKTAISVMKQATDVVANELNKEITFIHGNTISVVSQILKLRESSKNKVYPIVIVFNERIIEIEKTLFLEFTIPKIVICTNTVDDASDDQRLQTTFKNIIHPIFQSLQKELKRLHYKFDPDIKRTDIPYYDDEGKNKNPLNDLVDGCLIRDLKMKVMLDQCEDVFEI